MDKLGRLLAGKILVADDDTLITVVVEAKSISDDNRAILKSFCKTLLGEEDVCIFGTRMTVVTAQILAKDIKKLSNEDWVERISAPSLIGPRS